MRHTRPHPLQHAESGNEYGPKSAVEGWYFDPEVRKGNEYGPVNGVEGTNTGPVHRLIVARSNPYPNPIPILFRVDAGELEAIL